MTISSKKMLLVAGLLGLGCSPRNNGTLLAVEVLTDLNPTEVSRICVTLTPSSGKAGVKCVEQVAGSMGARVGFIPEGDPALGYTVLAQALIGTDNTIVLEQTATGTFSPGEKKVIWMSLMRGCSKVVCPTGQSCRSGICVPQETLAPPQGYTPPGTPASGSGGVVVTGSGGAGPGGAIGSGGGVGSGGKGSGGATGSGGGPGSGGAYNTGYPTITGVGGASGTNCAAESNQLMVSDFEQAENMVLIANSGWSTYGDGSATCSTVLDVPPANVAPARCGSSKVAHWTMTACTAWGAGAMSPMGSLRYYDARIHDGLVVWAKASQAASIDLRVDSPPTKETKFGGTCTPAGGLYCTPYGATLSVTNEWQKFKIPFSQMRLPTWGMVGSLDLQHVMDISWAVPANANVQVWFDDVAFYGGAGYSCSPGALIDDMEGAVDGAFSRNCRMGSWYAYDGVSAGVDAGAASHQPLPNSDFPYATTNCHQGRCVHTWGQGYGWAGAGLGLSSATNRTVPVDASSYKGLTLWYKSTSAMGIAIYTACGGYAYVAPAAATWTSISVPWASFVKPSGCAAALDGKGIVNLNFSAEEGAATTGFDIWVDDLQLTP